MIILQVPKTNLRKITGVHVVDALPERGRLDQPMVDKEQEDQLLHAVVHIGHVTRHLELVLVVGVAEFDELLGHARPV
jgi:hypothetical protein